MNINSVLYDTCSTQFRPRSSADPLRRSAYSDDGPGPAATTSGCVRMTGPHSLRIDVENRNPTRNLLINLCKHFAQRLVFEYGRCGGQLVQSRLNGDGSRGA